MHISIEHHTHQFNVSLSSSQGKEPFLTVKGCRVVDGQKGRFVSWPAKKMDSGKWWSHFYASEGFQAAVLQAYDDSGDKRTHAEMKAAPRARDDAARARQTRDDDPPF